MLFNDTIAGLGAQLLSAMGETVKLTDNSEVIWIFDAFGDAVDTPWEDDGLTTRMSDQPNPLAFFAADVFDRISENDTLIARNNQAYQVVRKYPIDAARLFKCELILAADMMSDTPGYDSWQ